MSSNSLPVKNILVFRRLVNQILLSGHFLTPCVNEAGETIDSVIVEP